MRVEEDVPRLAGRIIREDQTRVMVVGPPVTQEFCELISRLRGVGTLESQLAGRGRHREIRDGVLIPSCAGVDGVLPEALGCALVCEWAFAVYPPTRRLRR